GQLLGLVALGRFERVENLALEALASILQSHRLLQEELHAEIGMRPVEIEVGRAMLAVAPEEEPNRVRGAYPLGMSLGQGRRRQDEQHRGEEIFDRAGHGGFLMVRSLSLNAAAKRLGP